MTRVTSRDLVIKAGSLTPMLSHFHTEHRSSIRCLALRVMTVAIFRANGDAIGSCTLLRELADFCLN